MISETNSRYLSLILVVVSVIVFSNNDYSVFR